MAPLKLLARLAVGIFLLSSPTLIHADADRIHPRNITINLLQNGDSDSQGTPFKGALVKAWWDVVDLARIPASVNWDEPGTLEERFYGADIGSRDDAKEQIQTVFKTIMDLYTSKTTGQIRIACQDMHQDHRTDDEQTTCTNRVPGRKPKLIGGYAFAYGPAHDQGTVVLCAPFFAPGQENLGEVLAELRSHKDQQHDAKVMSGKFTMLLHELTHLPSIEGQQTVVIEDQKFNPKALIPDAAYGLYWVERLADSTKQRARTHLNADTYAWYASEKYFEAFFGTPDAYNQPRVDPDPPAPAPAQDQPDQPTKALNIVLENSRHGVPGDADFYDRMEWLLFSVAYGTGSLCATDQSPARYPTDGTITQLIHAELLHGTFAVKTQDGDCEYKNDGTGNPGALWCGGTAHSCREQADLRKGREADHYCAELGKSITGSVEQRAAVVCEW
ncbi:Uu.00g090120.m01.CDS01 [Anthostomella pinea]|uniref:Uu.00g090120.m01.CDS01 n=1 Tax=Anthostomella pinea TaxID=933095 RepID=A0AAI8VNR7_9PEZI|nr:Uu.00g090120.m01.CDS01 [Anthostomella pinea]